jgi:hypothetical protein
MYYSYMMFTDPASKVFAPPPVRRMRSSVAESVLEPAEELTIDVIETFAEEIHVLPVHLQIVIMP